MTFSLGIDCFLYLANGNDYSLEPCLLATRFRSPRDRLMHLIFHAPSNFPVQITLVICGAKTCASLKNIIAIDMGENKSAYN